jgi:hypothetical protein
MMLVMERLKHYAYWAAVFGLAGIFGVIAFALFVLPWIIGFGAVLFVR